MTVLSYKTNPHDSSWFVTTFITICVRYLWTRQTRQNRHCTREHNSSGLLTHIITDLWTRHTRQNQHCISDTNTFGTATRKNKLSVEQTANTAEDFVTHIITVSVHPSFMTKPTLLHSWMQHFRISYKHYHCICRPAVRDKASTALQIQSHTVLTKMDHWHAWPLYL